VGDDAGLAGAGAGEQQHGAIDRLDAFALLRVHANDGYALDVKVGTVLSGLGFSKQDWSAADGGIFRRLADAHRAGQAAAAKAQPAAARRADQPP
jgi:hypothetical protein